MKLSEIASISNFRWQNRKVRPNRSTNNGDMAVRSKGPISETVTELLKNDWTLKSIKQHKFIFQSDQNLLSGVQMDKILCKRHV